MANSNTNTQPKNQNYSKIRKGLIALRPWSFSASFMPVILGTTLAYNDKKKFNSETDDFSFLIFILCTIICLCVHAAGNLVNTYYDYKNGVDSNVTLGDRILVDKLLKPQDISKLGVIFYTTGSVTFLILLNFSKCSEFLLSAIYFGGLSLSFMYTGGIGFKYMALGDVIIIITFGPMTVLFAYVSQIGLCETNEHYYALFIKPLLYALPLAMNTECILHSNNTRDASVDKKAGIITLAIILGYTGSYILYISLLFLPYLIFLTMSIKLSIWYLLPISTIPLAFKLEKQFRFKNDLCLKNLPMETAKLNLLFGALYAFACLMSNY